MKGWPIVFSILVVLTGCVSYRPRPLPPADNAAALSARSLDDAGLKEFLEQDLRQELKDWPLTSWDLNSLTLAAFYFQPSLDVARAKLGEARAGIQTAGGRPNPTLSVTPGWSGNPPGGISPWFPLVSLDVPIETAGKRGKRIAVAADLSESARLNIIVTAWQVRQRVRANLLDFVVAGKRVALLEQQSAAQDEIAKRLRQRLDAGAISQFDLTTARLVATRTQLELNDARTRQVEARSQLAQAVGLPLAALDGVKMNFDLTPRAADDLASMDARRVALLGRADIQAALSDYAVSEETLRLEIAKQYPDVHLSPGYQFDQGEHKWSLGLSIELPVLNRNAGPIAEAEARRETAAARFTELQANVIAGIDRAVAGYGAARRQLQTSDAMLAAGKHQVSSVDSQLKAGAADQVDLFSAQIEFYAVALAQLDGERKLQQALGALEDAVQRPADSFAAALNRTTEKVERKETKP